MQVGMFSGCSIQRWWGTSGGVSGFASGVVGLDGEIGDERSWDSLRSESRLVV